MKKLLTFVFSLGLLLSSCSEDECEPKLDDTLTPVNFSALVADIQQSRAIKTTWAQNDQIAIFSDVAVKKNGNTSATSTSSITYTRGATDGVWTSPSADEAWYFADATTLHNFYAYYPVSTATSYTAVDIPNIYGQDGMKTVAALEEENDFMRGTGQATRDILMANLQMFRVFAIVNLKVKLKLNAFSGNAATLTDVKFTSGAGLPLVNSTASDKATVNLSDGQVTCSTGATSVTLHPTSGFALTTTEISIPIKIFPHHAAIQVQFTIGGKTSTAKAFTTTNFVGGRVYSYSVELGHDLLQVGVGDPVIFPWTDVTNGTVDTPIIPN